MHKSFLLALLFLYCQISACTGIKLIAEDGTLVHGRTLEFGVAADIGVSVIPRGFSFRGTTPNGAGLRYTTKYAAVGATCFGKLSLIDGMNEKGLAAGTFYFPGYAGYTPINKENQAKALAPTEFVNWLLTQFSTVLEIKEALSTIVIAPTVTPEWGDLPAPFHYIVYDKNGGCLVIEPLGGTLVVYDNEIGTLTNSPSFDWHMQNLRNYIHLSPYNASPVSLNGVLLKPFGAGSGMVGLPGDFTPTSRFVRAALFSAAATPSKNSQDAIFQIFHILNQFDIPVGLALDKTGDIIHSDQTQVTCARDPETLKYYFKTYQDQAIKSVDLTQFDLNARLIKTLHISGVNQVPDISSSLK
jgi:choloylglycine hydrolase